MEPQLTPTGNSAMSLVSRANEFTSIAKTFAESGLFTDVKGQAQCFVKIMAGAEMGLPPFTAMNSFHIIKGKVAMTASAIAARIKSSKRYDYRIVEKSSLKCVIEFSDKGVKVHTEIWDTARAGKAGTQNMDRFPDAMLFARAITAGARAVCPDIVGQYYTPEEMGMPVDGEGNYIESTARVVESSGDHEPVETPLTDAQVIAQLRPIYGELVKQVKAIGQEPCKPPINPTPAQIQTCIDEMQLKVNAFEDMGKPDPLLTAAVVLGGVIQPA